MSVIDRIEHSLHQLPLDPPYDAAWDRQPRRSFPVTVWRVFDSDGRCGVAAGDACRGLVDYLHLFVGTSPTDLDRHAEVLANVDFFDGRPWPLDLALWDLAGQVREQPLWEMVGGRGSAARPYASAGSRWPLAEVDERVHGVLDAGFGALKLRVGGDDLEHDLAVVERVRALTGNHLELMVDCNQGWRMPWDTFPPWDLDQARRLVDRLADVGVTWIEEPLHHAAVDDLVALRSSSAVPIAGGEMTRDPFLLHQLLERRALDVFQPDVAVTLGVSRMVDFARAVRSAGLVYSPHTWGCGPVLLANAHLAAGTGGTPWLEYPFDPPGWTPARRDYVLTEPVLPGADGLLHLGDAPGLGLRFDEERLAATATTSASYR